MEILPIEQFVKSQKITRDRFFISLILQHGQMIGKKSLRTTQELPMKTR